MKKIMFNDRYGLTEAVLSGRKTQTRRIITCPKEFKGEYVAGFHVYKRQSDGTMLEWPSLYDADESTIDDGYILPKYKVGEVVAVAQSYKDMGYSSIALDRSPKDYNIIRGTLGESKGWNNKMFVRGGACIHHIRITYVSVERLQDISDEDCIKELALNYEAHDMGYGKFQTEWIYQFLCEDKLGRTKEYNHRSPKRVFEVVIDLICGKGTWESNPFVFVYEFELVDL